MRYRKCPKKRRELKSLSLPYQATNKLPTSYQQATNKLPRSHVADEVSADHGASLKIAVEVDVREDDNFLAKGVNDCISRSTTYFVSLAQT